MSTYQQLQGKRTLWMLLMGTVATPCFKVLDLRAEVSSFHSVLADFAFIVFYLLTLPLQLVNKVVLDDRESGCGIVCQRLHHYVGIKK